MPELPEVETIRRGLAPHLEGRRIAAVRPSATLTYEVTKAPTTLTLTPSTAAAAPTGATPLVASLRSDGAGLGGKPIVFRITSTVDSSVVERVVIADAWGDATLSNVGLPLGTYQVQASFGTGVACRCPMPTTGRPPAAPPR